MYKVGTAFAFDRRNCKSTNEAEVYPSNWASRQSSSRSRKRSSANHSTRSSATDQTTNTTTNKSPLPYERAFQQNLIDSDIYHDGCEYPDGRLLPRPEIEKKLTKDRRDLDLIYHRRRSWTYTSEKFRRAHRYGFKEKKITNPVTLIMEGDPRDLRCVSGGLTFTNLDHLTDGTLNPGNPDLYYGARTE